MADRPTDRLTVQPITQLTGRQTDRPGHMEVALPMTMLEAVFQMSVFKGDPDEKLLYRDMGLDAGVSQDK